MTFRVSAGLRSRKAVLHSFRPLHGRKKTEVNSIVICTIQVFNRNENLMSVCGQNLLCVYSHRYARPVN